MPITEVLINQMKFNVLECASSGDFWESVSGEIRMNFWVYETLY